VVRDSKLINVELGTSFFHSGVLAEGLRPRVGREQGVGTGLELPRKVDQAGDMADEGRCGHLECTRGQSVEAGVFGCCVRGLLQEAVGHGSWSGLGQGGVNRVLGHGGGGHGARNRSGKYGRSSQR
jgi:hypothetical protein